MKRKILIYPDPFLSVVAEPVTEVDDELKTLIDEMLEAMYDARGIGLAATQVGVGKRLFVLDIPPDHSEADENSDENEDAGESDDAPYERTHNVEVFINPEIIERDGEMKYEEGCLSFPGLTTEVKRSRIVRVKALDRDGKPFEVCCEGLKAVAVQHEIDHLDGIVFIERVSRLKRDILKRRFKKMMSHEDSGE